MESQRRTASTTTRDLVAHYGRCRDRDLGQQRHVLREPEFAVLGHVRRRRGDVDLARCRAAIDAARDRLLLGVGVLALAARTVVGLATCLGHARAHVGRHQRAQHEHQQAEQARETSDQVGRNLARNGGTLPGAVSGWAFALWLGATQPVPPDASAPFELLWSAPAECPDAKAARASIERHLGRSLGAELGHGMRVAVAVERGEDGWRATLGFDGTRGRSSRELAPSSDCARAVDAATLVIAIAIDPTLMLPAQERTDLPEPPPVEEDPPPPEPARIEDDPVPPEPSARGVAAPPPVADLPPRRPRIIRGAIGIVAGPTFGGFPRVGGHTRLHGAATSRRWRVEIGAAFAGAPTHEDRGARLTMQRVTGDVRGCALFDPRPWLELVGCGGVELGVALAQPDGLTVGEPRRDLWLGFVLAPRVHFVVGRRAALVLGGDVVAPALPRAYTVGGLGTVFQTALVTGAVLAGVEVRIR